MGNEADRALSVTRDEGRGVLTITLDDPAKLNRVPMPARDRLAEIFDEAGRDDTVRTVVLAGAGEQALSAGGDVAGFLERTPEQLSRLHWNVAAAERCPKPVIARLRGYVFGVGLELALAADFRVAADDALLGLPEITLGMIPGSGGTQRLARMIGLGRAKDAIMRGKRIPADRALEWGLVTEVVPPEELDEAVGRLVDELGALSPLALGMAKRVLNHADGGPIELGLEIEGLAYGLLRSSHDFQEGVQAFLDKRRPRFEGR